MTVESWLLAAACDWLVLRCRVEREETERLGLCGDSGAWGKAACSCCSASGGVGSCPRDCVLFWARSWLVCLFVAACKRGLFRLLANVPQVHVALIAAIASWVEVDAKTGSLWTSLGYRKLPSSRLWGRGNCRESAVMQPAMAKLFCLEYCGLILELPM